jgi:hypothetical protein
MTREEKIKAMREIVRDMGEKTECETFTMWEVILLNITLYEADDYTDVCIQRDGDDLAALTIGGYDGESQGWCENVNESDDQTIDRVYAAMLEWAQDRDGIDSEHYMTVAAARRYMDEVLQIVENELNGFSSLRTYQERHGGYVWGEGVTIDCDMEEGNGTFFKTRSICYNVRSQEGKLAYIRRMSTNDRGYGDNLPFMGTAKEAADYLLEPYRAYFHEDEEDDEEV